MSDGAYVRNADGSLTEAAPVGWQGPDDQVDWEVYRDRAATGRGSYWVGEGYNRATYVGTTRPCRTRVGLWLAARWITGWHPMTFLWDEP